MKKQKDFYTPKEIYTNDQRHKNINDYEAVDLRLAIAYLIRKAGQQQSRNTRQKTGTGQRVKGLGSMADPSDPKTLSHKSTISPSVIAKLTK